MNLIKYPKFKEVRWQYANMTPGDCLFLPYSTHLLPLTLFCYFADVILLTTPYDVFLFYMTFNLNFFSVRPSGHR